MKTRHGIFAVLVMAIVASGIFSGCELEEVNDKAGKVAASAATAENATQAALEAADGVAGKIETATGYELPQDKVDKIDSAADNVAGVAGKVRDSAAAISAIPGPQQPVAGAVTAIAGAIAGIAGALGAFMENRKRKKAEKGIRAVTEAVDDYEGVGVAILKKTAEAGVADVVNEQYSKTTGA